MKTLLIISPALQQRNQLCSALTPRYEVVEAQKLDEAIHILIHDMVDLIVSDDSFCYGNILWLLRFKKNMSLNIPVIVLAERISIKTVVKYMKFGADEVKLKPYETLSLTEGVERLLKTSRKSARTRIPGIQNKRAATARYFREDILSLNPIYIHKMNIMKCLQETAAELKGQVLNAEITFDEALKTYEEKIKRVFAVQY